MNIKRMLLVGSIVLRGVVQIHALEQTPERMTKFAVRADLFSSCSLYKNQIAKSGVVLLFYEGIALCTLSVPRKEWDYVETKRQEAKVKRERAKMGGISYPYIVGALCLAWYVKPYLDLRVTSIVATLGVLYYLHKTANCCRRNEWVQKNLYGKFKLLDPEMSEMFRIPQHDNYVWIYDPDFAFVVRKNNLARYRPHKRYDDSNKWVVLPGFFNVAARYVRRLEQNSVTRQ